MLQIFQLLYFQEAGLTLLDLLRGERLLLGLLLTDLQAITSFRQQVKHSDTVENV